MRSTWSPDPALGSRLHIAVKAAVAASLAWVLGNLVPGVVGDFAYYAPLGAVLAVHPSVAGSLREAGQIFLALLLGAGIGALVDVLPLPGWLGIGLLVVTAILLAGWDRLGAARSWVISGALFTYILGNIDTSGFVAGLICQVTLGAVIGLALTVVLPPVPAKIARRRLDVVAESVAEQLDRLAALLRSDEHDPEAWADAAREIVPAALGVRESFTTLSQSLRGNVRARWWRARVSRGREAADVLERVAFLVENLAYMLSEVQESELPWLRTGSEASALVADVLDDLASVVRKIAVDAPLDVADTRGLSAGVDELTQLLTRTWSGEEMFPGAAVVVSLRRVLGVLPLAEDTPSPSITPLGGPSWPPRVGRRKPG